MYNHHSINTHNHSSNKDISTDIPNSIRTRDVAEQVTRDMDADIADVGVARIVLTILLCIAGCMAHAATLVLHACTKLQVTKTLPHFKTHKVAALKTAHLLLHDGVGPKI
jgi:hypothetical protein